MGPLRSLQNMPEVTVTTSEPDAIEVERRVATRKLWLGVAVLAYYVLNSVGGAHVWLNQMHVVQRLSHASCFESLVPFYVNN